MYPTSNVTLPSILADDLSDVPAPGKKLASARRADMDAIKKLGKWSESIAAYLASITFADEQIGKILDALETSSHANNTIIVLWSDHGWHHGEKGHMHKTTLWEEATRVPFIIAGPKIPIGVKCDRPVNLLDIYPTLKELCDLKTSGSFDGVSLVPLLNDPQAAWDRPSITELSGHTAVRSQRWRYIRYADGSEELYDHDADPNEWHNLAKKKKYAEVKQKLTGWIPKKRAPAAPSKKAYEFNPESYVWKDKKTGKTHDGKRPTGQ